MEIAMFLLAGFLLGGTWSMYKQGAGKPVVAAFAVFAVMATAAGVLYL